MCVCVHDYTWLLIGAVSDSTLLPGRSQSFSPKCLPLQAAGPAPTETHTNTHSDCSGPSVPWPHCIPFPLCQVDSVTVVFPPLPHLCVFSQLRLIDDFIFSPIVLPLRHPRVSASPTMLSDVLVITTSDLTSAYDFLVQRACVGQRENRRVCVYVCMCLWWE